MTSSRKNDGNVRYGAIAVAAVASYRKKYFWIVVLGLHNPQAECGDKPSSRLNQNHRAEVSAAHRTAQR